MRTIYHYVGSDAGAFRKGFQEVVRSEYYAGTISPVERAGDINVLMTRVLVEDMHIFCQRANTAVGFRRSVSNARDGVDVWLAWLVLEGSVQISRDREAHVVEPGSCLVFRSDKPFYARGEPGDLGTHRSIQIVLPPLALDQFGHFGDCGDRFRILSDRVSQTQRLARRLFDSFGMHAYTPSPAVISELKAYLYELSANAEVEHSPDAADLWQLIGRQMELLAYEPGLSAASLARRCGVSRRQLFYLFRQHGLSFAQALWDKRLERARELIASTPRSQLSIERIGSLTGFRNADHFSKSFKRRFGAPPGQFRKA